MQNNLTMNNRSWTLAAGESQSVPINQASGFNVISCTANFEVSLDGQHFSEVFAGFEYNAPDGLRIDNIIIRNPSGAGNTINLLWGVGKFRDNRLSLSGSITVASITNPVSINTGAGVSASGDVIIAGGATTTALAFFSGRKRGILRNPASNAYPFKIGGGGAAPSAASGFLLEPGETLEVFVVGSISAYNMAPYAQPITASWEA